MSICEIICEIPCLSYGILYISLTHSRWFPAIKYIFFILMWLFEVRFKDHPMLFFLNVDRTLSHPLVLRNLKYGFITKWWPRTVWISSRLSSQCIGSFFRDRVTVESCSCKHLEHIPSRVLPYQSYASVNRKLLTWQICILQNRW